MSCRQNRLIVTGVTLSRTDVTNAAVAMIEVVPVHETSGPSAYLIDTYEAAEASGNQNFKVLLDFSLGRRDDLSAMVALGIDSEEDLFLLMAQAHLPMPQAHQPMPRLPDA